MRGGEPRNAEIGSAANGSAGLSVEALSAATLPFENYVPLDDVGPDVVVPDTAMWARLERDHGIPREHVLVIRPPGEDDTEGWPGPDVSTLALAGLGAPATAQPLFLVRSGPLRDGMVAALAQLVHESGWAGEDVGLTDFEELGGTAVFGVLEWAVPEQTGATAVICDEPVFIDARVPGRFQAVGLRLRRGPGPLRVLGWGEGAPDDGPGWAEHRFSGRGPCDGWLAFHEALAAEKVRDGDRVLMHACGPLREGWLLVEAVDTASVLLGGDVALIGAES